MNERGVGGGDENSPDFSTRVQWRVGKGKLVVRIKVDEVTMCEEFDDVMKAVKEDLHRMLFQRQINQNTTKT